MTSVMPVNTGVTGPENRERAVIRASDKARSEVTAKGNNVTILERHDSERSVGVRISHVLPSEVLGVCCFVRAPQVGQHFRDFPFEILRVEADFVLISHHWFSPAIGFWGQFRAPSAESLHAIQAVC
jgi:hypothetical protein